MQKHPISFNKLIERVEIVEIAKLEKRCVGLHTA